MADDRRSYIMSQIKSVSKIERIPESLKALQLRRHPKGIYGKPDFANKGRKTALFIDGCFWHSCPEHSSIPKTNAGFWRDKLRRNSERNAEVNSTLGAEGWIVIRIFECSLRRMK